MDDQDRTPPSLWASLTQLGKSLTDLARAFKGEAARADETVVDVPTPETEALLALPIAEPNSEAAQLLTQHTPGWHTPRPARLPVPTYAPAMTAFGIVFIALGAVTMWPLSVVGAVIFVAGIAKWIGELLHD